jgi:hypothetical protein
MAKLAFTGILFVENRPSFGNGISHAVRRFSLMPKALCQSQGEVGRGQICLVLKLNWQAPKIGFR